MGSSRNQSASTKKLTRMSPGRRLHKRAVLNRAPKRQIVRWNATLDREVLMGITHVFNYQGIKVPWDEVAKVLGRGITGGSILQHIAKIRLRHARFGYPVPPALTRGGGKIKENSCQPELASILDGHKPKYELHEYESGIKQKDFMYHTSKQDHEIEDMDNSDVHTEIAGPSTEKEGKYATRSHKNTHDEDIIKVSEIIDGEEDLSVSDTEDDSVVALDSAQDTDGRVGVGADFLKEDAAPKASSYRSSASELADNPKQKESMVVKLSLADSGATKPSLQEGKNTHPHPRKDWPEQRTPMFCRIPPTHIGPDIFDEGLSFENMSFNYTASDAPVQIGNTAPDTSYQVRFDQNMPESLGPAANNPDVPALIDPFATAAGPTAGIPLNIWAGSKLNPISFFTQANTLKRNDVSKCRCDLKYEEPINNGQHVASCEYDPTLGNNETHRAGLNNVYMGESDGCDLYYTQPYEYRISRYKYGMAAGGSEPGMDGHSHHPNPTNAPQTPAPTTGGGTTNYTPGSATNSGIDPSMNFRPHHVSALSTQIDNYRQAETINGGVL